MTCVIFDLDGCLSDDTERKYLAEAKRWDEYHSRCHQDPPMNIGAVKYHHDEGHDIIFITGRTEPYRDKTERWIEKHTPLLGCKYDLLMRSEGDYRSSPEFKKAALRHHLRSGVDNVICAYDDRDDVLIMWSEYFGIPVCKLSKACPYPDSTTLTTADVLQEMADTFRERNAVYGNNYQRVAPIIKILWPNGLPKDMVTDNDTWHLFELIVVKLTRFAQSDLTHVDSIHDMAVYAAMIETEIRRNK